MREIVTEDSIRETCDSLVENIRNQEEPQRKKVEEQIKSISNKFAEVVSDAGVSTNAFLPVDSIDLESDPRTLPDGVSIGMLKHPDLGKAFMPAVLPFAEANITGFYVDSSCETSVMDVLQMLALRFLLSIPVNLVNCHYVDLHSYGQEAKMFGRISSSIISDKKGLEDFLTEMETLVMRLNRNELLNCKTLREYNSDSSCIGVPYHFVFISNIQDIRETQIIARINRLCSNKCASNCGIYFFYTIGESVSQQNNEVNELLRISEIVEKKGSEYYFSNTIYGKDFEERYAFDLDQILQSGTDKLIDGVNERRRHVKPQVVSFDKIFGEMIKGEQYWKGDATKGIKIPIGRKGANEFVNFELAGDTSDYFAMIGGRPGYGKTILLHDIICNGSIIYSPEELQFYLVDCTNGAGFKPYEQLPHAHVVVTTRQREYTDSAIEQLISEMYRRAELFKSIDEETGVHVEKIEDYRKETGVKLPRILVIIDEFQVLLEKADKLSRKIGGSLEKIVREGRKYGIHIVFCTQSFRNIDFDTELITLRMAFNLKENDSFKVLGNESAAHLTKKGEAVLNNCNGEKSSNVFFQAAYMSEKEKIPEYVNFSISKCNEKNIELPKRFVFDGKAVSNIGKNEQFIELLTGNCQNPENIITYLGVPLFIREQHSFMTFRKARGSNLLVCGTDKKAALSTLALVNFQLSQMVCVSDMRIVDYFNDSSPESRYLTHVAKLCNIEYLKKKEISAMISSIDELLKRRIDDDMAGLYNANSPVFLTIAYLQEAPDLQDDGYKKSECKSKLENILKYGPGYGIHVIAYAYNYMSLSDTFDRDAVSSFGNRVVLQYGAAQQEADNLAEGTAILVADNNVTTYEQDPFMPYNECISGNLQDEILDYIFSIYNK